MRTEDAFPLIVCVAVVTTAGGDVQNCHRCVCYVTAGSTEFGDGPIVRLIRMSFDELRKLERACCAFNIRDVRTPIVYRRIIII